MFKTIFSLHNLFVLVIRTLGHLILFRISNFEFRASDAFRCNPKVITIYILFITAVVSSAPQALADNVGITKARLIQTSEKSYVIEADVTQALSWAIKSPIFPDRFQVSELDYINQSGWIVVQATASTEGEPLSPEDEILLPWMRNGAALSVQWLDGSLQQSLFLRSLEGIRVPVNLLMKQYRTLREVSVEHFFIGLKHLKFKWVHSLLAGVLVMLLPGRKIFYALLYYTFGQFFSLILADFGMVGFDMLFTDLLGVILVFIIAYGVVRQKYLNQFMPLLFLFGLLHGLAYAGELSLMSIQLEHKIPVLFMFNLAIDVGHYGMAGLLFLPLVLLAWKPLVKRVGAYAVGSLAVALVFMLFQDHVIAGRTDILNLSPEQLATQYTLPASRNTQTGGSRPRGARQLTSQVMTYLSVEPFEVRQEILIQARAAVKFLGVDDTGMGSIPVESLEPVKNGILDLVKRANPIAIDNQPVEPILVRADFVTLGPAGVMIRPEPVEESLDNGIIGLTLVYETPDLADAIEINWRLFSDYVPKIEATTTDPFGGATMILSRDDSVLLWKNRLSGFKVPVMEEIAVEKQKLPVISVIILLFVVTMTFTSLLRSRQVAGRPVLLCVASLAFFLYPFVRIPMELAYVDKWKPSAERTSDILDGVLTNVYRSFDVRNESDVYDRLAMSVTGDQLTNIYLQNRQSLELENRGGARANVDEVKIEAVNRIKNTDDNSFAVDAAWTVSGSVNHFGHTHYRRNYYHAMVTLVADKGAWKIKDIELIDEKRLL